MRAITDAVLPISKKFPLFSLSLQEHNVLLMLMMQAKKQGVALDTFNHESKFTVSAAEFAAGIGMDEDTAAVALEQVSKDLFTNSFFYTEKLNGNLALTASFKFVKAIAFDGDELGIWFNDSTLQLLNGMNQSLSEDQLAIALEFSNPIAIWLYLLIMSKPNVNQKIFLDKKELQGVFDGTLCELSQDAIDTSFDACEEILGNGDMTVFMEIENHRDQDAGVIFWVN